MTNRNTGQQYMLPPAPEGCFWHTHDHDGTTQVTVSLYRNFLSLGSTLVDSRTQDVAASSVTCRKGVLAAKQACAQSLAQGILKSQSV